MGVEQQVPSRQRLETVCTTLNGRTGYYVTLEDDQVDLRRDGAVLLGTAEGKVGVEMKRASSATVEKVCGAAFVCSVLACSVFHTRPRPGIVE